MKYTRVEIKNKFSDNKLIICFIISIPLLAFVVGKMLMGLVQSGYAGSSKSLKDFNNVYYLQLGVYEKEQGAKEKIKFLNSKGVNSIILKEDKYYKVVSCIASSDKKMQERKKDIESKEVPTYIKSMEMKDHKKSESKEYSDMVKQYILYSLNGKKALMESSYKSISEYKSLSKNNIELQKQLNNLIKTNVNLDYEKDEKDYYKNIIQIILNYNKLI